MPSPPLEFSSSSSSASPSRKRKEGEQQKQENEKSLNFSSSGSSNILLSSQSEDWKQVTPKKERPSLYSNAASAANPEGVMQNKFLQFSKESPSGKGGTSWNGSYGNQSSSSRSLNRFDALIAGADSMGKGKEQKSSVSIARGNDDAPATPTQLAMQKQIATKIREIRKKVPSTKKRIDSSGMNSSFLDNSFHFRQLNAFLKDFHWDAHVGKLENLWFSVLGNPTKFIFILLDYLEECFIEPAFPSISFTSSNWMDELPVEALAKNPTPSQALLLSAFQERIAEPIEEFLRCKLESPEFKIEDVFGALLEIIVKCQRLKEGQNSFASILVLATLGRIFPFQALLALRELLSCRGISLHQQGFFFLWFAGVIFQEEPSQCTSIFELLLQQCSSQASQIPNALLLAALQLLEELLHEIVALQGSNCALLLEYQGKLLEFLGSGAAISKSANQIVAKLPLSILGPALAKHEEASCSSEMISMLFRLGQSEPRVLEFACMLGEAYPESFCQVYLGMQSNFKSSLKETPKTSIYQQFLPTSSRSFLGLLSPEKHAILIEILNEHTQSLLSKPWNNTEACQKYQHSRKEAVINSGILAELASQAARLPQPMKRGLGGGGLGNSKNSSGGRVGQNAPRKGSFAFAVLLSLLIVVVGVVLSFRLFFATMGGGLDSSSFKRRIESFPIGKQAIKVYETTLRVLSNKVKPRFWRASRSVVLYGQQAVEKYKPVVKTVSQRCIERCVSLARIYGGPSALRSYRERTGEMLKWVQVRVAEELRRQRQRREQQQA